MSIADSKYSDPNKIRELLTKISDETGITLGMIGHIYKSVSKERKKDTRIGTKNVTHFIILDLINNDQGLVKDILSLNGIKSSEDFGLVIKKFCEEGYLIKEESDNYDDFNGQFNLDTIAKFILENNLKKDKDWYKLSCNLFCLVGFIIVAFSYSSTISFNYFWLGCILILIGWALLTYRKKIKSILAKYVGASKTKTP